MSNYAILHVDKITSHQVLVQRSNHNFRKIISDNVNPEMIMYNRQLIGDAGSSYEKLFQVAVKASPYYNTHNVAKNAVLACEILLSIPHEVKDNIDLDKWCDANIEWLNERFGKDNVKNAVLHLDEETPHIHALVIPIAGRGRLNAKHFINGKKGCAILQDSYADKMSIFGLQRGIRRTRAKHEAISEFYARIDNALSIAGRSGEELKEEFRRQEGETEEEQLERFEYALSSFVVKAEHDRLKLEEQERKLQELSKHIDDNIKAGDNLVDMINFVLERDDDETNKKVLKMALEYAVEKYEILKQREQSGADKLTL